MATCHCVHWGERETESSILLKLKKKYIVTVQKVMNSSCQLTFCLVLVFLSSSLTW